MSQEIAMDHHNKSSHEIYRIVPHIVIGLLSKYSELDGVVAGGSYANGKFNYGDDIDSDIIFGSYPETWKRKLSIDEEIRQVFKGKSLILYIRHSLQTDTIPLKYRLTTYSKYPNTPYIVRNESVARAWGLV